ncbi:MAG: POT family MFS transporter [Planctomycetia bacterium]|nr:POT family MFS transporter [Planctomycetia bacterium]
MSDVSQNSTVSEVSIHMTGKSSCPEGEGSFGGKGDSPQGPRLPAAVPYIVGNEAAERFSYYGMKAILMVYMTKVLGMADAEASGWGHLFQAGVYLFPIFGALLADLYWGKYKTIFYLSILYCFGHVVLALPGGIWGGNLKIPLCIGLFLIALGAGGIKSCVSAIVGDQFTAQNKSLLEKVYGWFYLSINVGSLCSMLLIPFLYESYGPEVAFGVPAIFMALATFIFWKGRSKYIILPPSGANFLRELKTPAGYRAVLKISLVFVFLVVVWAIYDQTGYRWVAQGEKMNPYLFSGMHWLPPSILELKILPAQMQAINPFLILVLVPLFSYVIYPFINRYYRFTIVKKIACGLWLIALSALLPVWFEMKIQQGVEINIAWQFLAYFLLTAAEVMVSVTSLEFAYTQAPPSMKSLIMGVYLLTFALGNLLVAAVNGLCEVYQEANFLAGISYYWFFFILGVLNALLFLFVAAKYQEKTYLQDDKLE